MNLKVQKSKNLKGVITMPRSKLHSFRALILASMAKGISTIKFPKYSNDWNKAIRSMQYFGAKIHKAKKGVYEIHGVGGIPKTPNNIIDVGNSGTMLAFLIGIASCSKSWTVITGDKSIRTIRKVSKNSIKPLNQLGVKIISTKDDGMAPFIIKGPVKKRKAVMDGTGCQPVFSLLIASALAKNPVDIFVDNPGETAYIDLLLYWFDKTSLKYKNNSYTQYYFPGNQIPKPFDTEIPFEWSAPAYPLLAAVITKGSEIKIQNMNLQDPYGDKQVLNILKSMGANISIKEKEITAKTSNLMGIEVDMNLLPDQLPTIAVAACFAKGKTIIKNALTARWKECDRIAAICNELKKMGAKIEEKKDGLLINQDGSWMLKGANLQGYQDHRMVLSLTIAGLGASGETNISDAEWLDKSFGSFIPEMKKANAKLKLY